MLVSNPPSVTLVTFPASSRSVQSPLANPQSRKYPSTLSGLGIQPRFTRWVERGALVLSCPLSRKSCPRTRIWPNSNSTAHNKIRTKKHTNRSTVLNMVQLIQPSGAKKNKKNKKQGERKIFPVILFSTACEGPQVFVQTRRSSRITRRITGIHFH